jgi:Ca2+-transporting ATPase
MNWHQLETREVIEKTKSSANGLTGSAVDDRRAQYGLNQLQETKRRHPLMLFFNQFKDFMILVLIASAVISGVTGNIGDCIVIIVIVALNAIIGFVQEYHAENAIKALKQLAAAHAKVIRDGEQVDVAAEELVPGDLVLLEAGSLVPADLRLLEAHVLRVDESSLTGEAIPVDKITAPINDADVGTAEQVNMAFKGSLVVNGRGKGVVVATGMNTEMGKIARMLQEKETLTPLQKRMADFGKKLSLLVLGICAIMFVAGIIQGEEPVQMLMLAISLAVAAIPEALPALITVALARGAARMVKKNALIRRLSAVETLGSVTYICSDKTGTLTQNRMTVTVADPYGQAEKIHDELTLLECAMSVSNDISKTGDKLVGDPTEVALVVYVNERLNNRALALKEQFPRVAELPFDSTRKCMTTIHQVGDRYLAISKGAAESIVKLLQPGEAGDMILRETNGLAAKGLRVLAFGYRIFTTLPNDITIESIETDLLYAGTVGMIDPPRAEAKAAIGECQKAGIRPVMITGDHASTAEAIARELGIMSHDDMVITGNELASMDEQTLSGKIEHISVYARVSPEQKLTIVKALQKKGHFVAMTGDGVNDAPSLKMANIGVAMGITGTDVSKEAAHMILLDDNFATIVNSVREGRRIYDNIRKFVKYIMTCNGAEILTIFFAPILGLPMPLLPIQILWINLVTDGLPGLALSLEKEESNVMSRRPRRPGESLFAEGVGRHIIWMGILMAVVTLGTQAVAIRLGDTHWRTMVFTVLSFSQLGHVFAIRSERDYIYGKLFFANMPLLLVVVFTCLLQVAIVYLPAANRVFGTAPLTTYELLICMGLATIVFHAVEVEKWIKNKKERRANKAR